jgi:hypothetical protein
MAVVKQTTLDEEEEEMLKKGMVDWNALKRKEFWIDKKMISKSGAVAVEPWLTYNRVVHYRHSPDVRCRVCLKSPTDPIPYSVIVALMAFFHTDIIHWLTPAANKFRALKGGWAIPIAIIFALVSLGFFRPPRA